MERALSMDLMATGRRVTRHQINKLRHTFYFLELPAELRNIVYEFALGDPANIKTYFDYRYKLVLKKRNSKPCPTKKAPNVLVLNKQIHREAVGLLQTRSIIFDHGLLTVDYVAEVISSNILRQVTSLEISDSGHPMIKGPILPESWNGYMRLLQQLGDVLSQGHKLKSLKVAFADERLKEHMTVCYNVSYECGFRDGLRDAANALGQVRGIKTVTLEGLNPQHALSLKARMESLPTSFLDLPCEIRDIIYEHGADWNDVSRSLLRTMADWTNKKEPWTRPRRSTPTVLLLNRQIYKEASEVLQKKPLVITFPQEHGIQSQTLFPDMMQLISRKTLKQVRVLHLKLEAWEWVFSITQRVPKALSTSTKLESLHITYFDTLKRSFLDIPGQRYPDAKLNHKLKQLAAIRGVKEVVFHGDLPAAFTDILKAIMTSTPTAGEVLPALKAVRADGTTVDLPADDGDAEVAEAVAAGIMYANHMATA